MYRRILERILDCLNTEGVARGSTVKLGFCDNTNVKITFKNLCRFSASIALVHSCDLALI